MELDPGDSKTPTTSSREDEKMVDLAAPSTPVPQKQQSSTNTTADDSDDDIQIISVTPVRGTSRTSRSNSSHRATPRKRDFYSATPTRSRQFTATPAPLHTIMEVEEPSRKREADTPMQGESSKRLRFVREESELSQDSENLDTVSYEEHARIKQALETQVTRLRNRWNSTIELCNGRDDVIRAREEELALQTADTEQAVAERDKWQARAAHLEARLIQEKEKADEFDDKFLERWVPKHQADLVAKHQKEMARVNARAAKMMDDARDAKLKAQQEIKAMKAECNARVKESRPETSSIIKQKDNDLRKQAQEIRELRSQVSLMKSRAMDYLAQSNKHRKNLDQALQAVEAKGKESRNYQAQLDTANNQIVKLVHKQHQLEEQLKFSMYEKENPVSEDDQQRFLEQAYREVQAEQAARKVDTRAQQLRYSTRYQIAQEDGTDGKGPAEVVRNDFRPAGQSATGVIQDVGSPTSSNHAVTTAVDDEDHIQESCAPLHEPGKDEMETSLVAEHARSSKEATPSTDTTMQDERQSEAPTAAHREKHGVTSAAKATGWTSASHNHTAVEDDDLSSMSSASTPTAQIVREFAPT